MDDTIITAMKKIGNSSQMKDEMLLLMSPYTHWEELLVQAPMAVSILGCLMGLATQSDFSLEDSAPEGGFKVLHNPRSFRACLVQVANSGWKAFNLANKNMDQIRILCGQVPEHFKTALQILFCESRNDLEDMLLIELREIKFVAEKGFSLSAEVEDKFICMIDIIEELNEACVASKGSHEDIPQEHKLRKVAREFRQKELENRKKNMEQLFEEDKKKLLTAEETFKKYCDKVPSGMSFLGMQLFENVVTGLGNLIPLIGVAKGFTPAFGTFVGVAKDTAATESERNEAPGFRTPFKETQMSPEFHILGIILCRLASLCKECNEIVPEKHKQQNQRKETAEVYQILLKDMTEISNHEEKVIVEKLIALCQEVIDIEEMDDVHRMEISRKIRNLDEKLNILQCKAFRYAQPLASPPPRAAKILQGTTATENAAYSAMYKVECSKENLKDIRALNLKKQEDLNKTWRQLMETMEELSTINLQEISYQKIKQLLSRGIKALAKIKEQWGKVVQLFQIISNIIENILQRKVRNFSDHAEGFLVQPEGINYTGTDCKRDIIYTKALQGVKITSLVHMIAQTYVKVSKEHIMDSLAGLTKILAYDAETQVHLIDKARKELNNKCKCAQEEIRKFIAEENEKCNQQIDARLKTIREVYERAYPQPTEEEKEAMEKAIAEAHNDLDDYN